MTKKTYEKIFTILTLIAIFGYCFYRLRYSVVANDDVEDFIPYNYELWHGRIVFEVLTYWIMIWLPTKLNISLQNFAIFSSTFFKTLIWTTLIYQICCISNNIKKIPFLFPFMLITIHLLLLALLISNEFSWTFDIFQYYTGYIGAMICWILFWKKLYNLYVNKDEATNKNLIILSIFSFLAMTGNEELNIFANILLVLLFLFTKEKNKNLIKIIGIPLITMSIINLALYTNNNGATGMLEKYNLHFIFTQPLEIYKNYIKLFFERIILENIFIFIPFITVLILFFKEKINNSKLLKYTLLTIISMFLYTFILVHIPHNAYMTKNSHPFWFLHCGLLTSFDISLLIAILFFIGNVITKLKKHTMYLTILLIILCFSTQIFINRPIGMDLKYCTKIGKEHLYQADKMVNFYFKQNKTAIISKDVTFGALKICEIDELRENKEIYTKIYSTKESQYLQYVKQEYNLDVTPGLTFLPEEEAIKIYIEQGGSFTDEELEKLDFQKLKNNSI